ncbi:MAG: peptidase S10 [Gemmatimonadetes bacterium]|nr:MAG: peptidase S10 [Gemmatimonadota bacterium]
MRHLSGFQIGRVGLVVAAVTVGTSTAVAQARQPGAAPRDTSTRPIRDTLRAAVRDSLRPSTRDFLSMVETPPVVSRHSIRLHGSTLSYTATTGMLPIRNDTTGAVEGGIFFVAYNKDGVGDPGTRPLSFVFNGGPGSSTVWLHMGAFGPKKVRLNPDGTNPPPPYAYEDNQFTLLDQTDLVFLDPVGTGFSRAARPELGPKFWGLDEDIHAVGEFVRLYLTRFDRWGSPKFLAGESYGTTRAAHLSGYLADRGIALNGVVLISTVLNFGASAMDAGNDLGFINFIPSYAATAWYHKKLPPDLQRLSVEQVTTQAERWAESDYARALMRGARLTEAERHTAAEQLARFSGTSTSFAEENDLRINLGRFNQELLRDKHLTSGRLDSRFTTYATDQGAERGQFDPSEASIRNSFSAVLSEYVRRELGYRNEDVYYILGGGIGRWRYPQNNGYANVVPSLERAFAKNPEMRLYVAEGYYDMATPYFAVEYTLAHMSVDPRVRAGITTERFEAGHMVYIDSPSMTKMREGLRRFIDGALPQAQRAQRD